MYLLNKYRGSGRTFVLQDHEADYHAAILNPTTGTYSENTDVGQANFKKYWETRQKAITDARAAVTSDVKLYNMCEVSRVRESLRTNAKSLARDVLPQVTCDLVGYSAHDTAILNESGAGTTLRQAIEYIRSKARPSPTFGTNQVVISEIAAVENVDPGIRGQIVNITNDYLRAGMPWVLYWAFYDNGTAGNWLIKPNNDFSPTFYDLIAKLGLSARALADRVSTQSSFLDYTPTPTPASAAGSCPFNGQTVASGASVKAYQAATVPAGQTCTSQQRACSNGTLSGSYQYAGCTQTATQTTSTTGSTNELCSQTSDAYKIYLCETYNSAFGYTPPLSVINLFSGLYQQHAIGCHATIRDIVREAPSRLAAANIANVNANQEYIYKMYWVSFGRGAATGDNPAGILSMRLSGTSLDDVDNIFYQHPGTKARCESRGLKFD